MPKCKEPTSVNVPAPPDIGLDAFLKGAMARPLPPSPEQQTAALRIERERIHNDNLKKWEALYLFLVATGITEEEVANIFSECDVEGRIGEIFQSQVEFIADHAAEQWPELQVTPEQIRRAGLLIFGELYTDLSANLTDVIRFLLTVKLCDGIGLEMSEADLKVFRRVLMPSLLKSVSSPARRRKGIGRPAIWTPFTLDRAVRNASLKILRRQRKDKDPIKLTLAAVAAEMKNQRKAKMVFTEDNLKKALKSSRLKWGNIKGELLNSN